MWWTVRFTVLEQSTHAPSRATMVGLSFRQAGEFLNRWCSARALVMRPVRSPYRAFCSARANGRQRGQRPRLIEGTVLLQSMQIND
jgi:hypothetical protein